ncbi:MAG: hypothetical protein VCB07_02585 [Gammaproteobacteria bacterium]
MNDEQRKNTGPFGLRAEIGDSGVIALENSTTIPHARRPTPRKFKIADFRAERAHVYFRDGF